MHSFVLGNPSTHRTHKALRMPVGTEGRDVAVHDGLAATATTGREHSIVVLPAEGFAVPLVESTLAKRLATLGTDEALRVPSLPQRSFTGLKGEGGVLDKTTSTTTIKAPAKRGHILAATLCPTPIRGNIVPYDVAHPWQNVATLLHAARTQNLSPPQMLRTWQNESTFGKHDQQRCRHNVCSFCGPLTQHTYIGSSEHLESG